MKIEVGLGRVALSEMRQSWETRDVQDSEKVDEIELELQEGWGIMAGMDD